MRLYPGETGFVVNGKPAEEFFSRPTDLHDAAEPLAATETLDKFRVSVVVAGGGVTGQAGAVRLGVARALLVFDPELRGALRQEVSSPAIRVPRSGKSLVSSAPVRRRSTPSDSAPRLLPGNSDGGLTLIGSGLPFCAFCRRRAFAGQAMFGQCARRSVAGVTRANTAPRLR